MKAFIKLVFLTPIFFMLGGCWDRIELNDLALITALAFDKGENNQIQVTAQIIIPQNQGGGGAMGGGTGGSGGAGRRTTIRSEKGINIAEALSKLQRKVPRKQFWGQCKVFIFSEALAKSGIQEHFDFLIRHPQQRERAYMFVSKGMAADALELYPPIERSSAEVLRKLSDLETGIRVDMEQLSIMLKGDSRTAILPLVYVLPKSKSAEPFQMIPYILGTAIFNKDKMVGEFSEKMTRGVMWVRNEINEYTVTFHAEKSEDLVSLSPVKAKVRLIPKIEGEQWIMNINVHTEGNIVQNGTIMNPTNPELLKTLEKAYASDVRERIELAMDEAQHKLKVDILNFAKEFHRKYPKQWEQAKENWEQIFPEIQVHTEIEAHITSPGNVNAPGGMPKEEVKEK